MAVSFNDIGDKFDEVFGFIRRDLKQILTLDMGGNYAVALLVACACDTLAEYKHGRGKGYKVFRKLLPPGCYRRAAKPIYKALRDGFVHRYNGYDIPFEGQVLQVSIAWKKGRHLSVRTIDGAPNLVLNASRLCDALFLEFEKYRSDLKKSRESRQSFLDRYKKLNEEVKDEQQICALKRIVSRADTASLSPEEEAPWMAGFGQLADLASENRRLEKLIEDEFERLELGDTA